MNPPKKYQNYRIDNVDDVKILIEDIKRYGNFTQKAYNSLLKKSTNSTTQPQRIRLKLIHQAKPLITVNTVNKRPNYSISKKEQKENLEKETKKIKEIEFLSRPHNANEFTFKDGAISIQNFVLKSKRIKAFKKSWLKGIEHDFYIARDSSFNNNFHFVPYTDLTYFLNAIKDKIDKAEEEKELIREKERITRIKKRIRKDFKDYFYNYFHIESPTKGLLLDMSHKALCDFLNIEASFYSGWNDTRETECLCVPMKDVKVMEDFIEIKLENVNILSSDKIDNNTICRYIIPNFDDFFSYVNYYLEEDYLLNYFKSVIHKSFNKQIDRSLEELKKQSPLRVKTHITSKSFKNLFKETKFFTFSCYKDFSIKWFLFNHIDYYGFINGIIAKQFVFKNETKAWLEAIRTKYKSIFIKEDWELDYNELAVKNCCSEWSPYNSLYESVDFFYIRKENSRLSFCDEKKHHVLFFTEDMSHCSDDWSPFGGGHYSYGHKSFLVWSNSIKNCIELYPCNKKLSNYRFYIDTNKITREKAVYILYKYFSSNIKNKRQGFSLDYIPFFKEIGIVIFSRF